MQTLDGRRGVERSSRFGDYAATTAAQIAGTVVGRPGSLPTLNWCFLIFAASSIPLIVTAAVSKRLKPSIGPIRCFTRRWSCSIPLLRYLLERTRTRFGIFPSAFNSMAGIHALVVDDNAQAREILTDSLRGFALRADAVASGEDAIRALAAADMSDPYQLVLMDWHMPGMDGLQASAIIKRQGRLQNVPRIVMVTAFGREEIRAQAEQIGIDGYVLKPVNASVLYDTMMDLFGGGGQEVEGRQQRKGESPSYDARGIRVLLVEDNELNQQVATELLESAGAIVTVAGNGKIAVDLLRDGPQPPAFDIVLMDLQMPEMDGFTATRHLRADSRFNDLPILAMTAHALVEERERCLQAGMNGHVTKPIDPDALFAALTQWAKRREPATSAPEKKAAPRMDVQVPPIEGIDIAGGLKRVAGNQKLYRSLLEQFVAKQADASSQIADALEKNDRALAERLAHTMKGVAANLGMSLTQETAARLEAGQLRRRRRDVRPHRSRSGAPPPGRPGRRDLRGPPEDLDAEPVKVS